MDLERLREKHPTFTYRACKTQKQDRNLRVSYRFEISPDIVFHPRITIPMPEHGIDHEQVSNFTFHLGLIEAVSYWKSTCSPYLMVDAGSLTDTQTRWWHDLFIHGLGEFYYQNKIDFTKRDFLRIVSTDKKSPLQRITMPKTEGDLIMVGGGKDSAVTIEALAQTKRRKNVLLLNPTKASRDTTATAGYYEPIIVTRTIDKRLLQLNEQGYLNGHTPFSAYLSFVGLFVGAMHGFEHVITSNEASAGEGSVAFHGIDVNHQYSKSARYERLFREYSTQYLSTDISYFSFLRPLSELQIAALFAQTDKYDKKFCSCNVSRNAFFCGECPKCAFVYLSLTPFIDQKRTHAIFGKLDYFEKPKIQKHIIDLVGLGKHKPFDCVGTEEESKRAVALAIYQYEQRGDDVPNFLRSIQDTLNLTREYIPIVAHFANILSQNELTNGYTRSILKCEGYTIDHIKNKIRTDWNKHHFLPKEYQKILKKQLKEL